MSKTDDKADVWMPLYVGDYLADTGRLTTEQHGAYLLLMLDYWRNGPPPDDEEILQNITRLSKFLWKKHGPVLRKFFTAEDGVLRHKRIDEEMTKAASGKASATEKARNAANARWGNNDAPSIPQALPMQSPSSSSSPSPKNQTIGEAVVSSAPAVRGIDGTPRNEAEWMRHMQRRHGVTISESSAHDRKRYWPTFASWVNASIRTDQVDAAVAKAQAESTEPISNLVAYAARVLDTMTTPRPQQARIYHDERADVIAELTGANRRKREQQANDHGVIDVPAKRIG